MKLFIAQLGKAKASNHFINLYWQKAKKNDIEDSDEENPKEMPGKTNAPRFMMLDVEDGSDDDDNSEQEQKIVTKSSQRKAKKNAKANQVSAVENSTEDGDEKITNQHQKEKKGKASKKGKADEDIDAILAELSLQNNSANTKKKDTKKKEAKHVMESVEVDKETTASSDGVSLTVENHMMTQDEIAKKMEEMYPSSEDEKKAKKKKNKKQKASEKGKMETDLNNEEDAVQEIEKTSVGSQKNKKDQKKADENGVAKEKDVQEAAEKPQATKSAGQKKKDSNMEVSYYLRLSESKLISQLSIIILSQLASMASVELLNKM